MPLRTPGVDDIGRGANGFTIYQAFHLTLWNYSLSGHDASYSWTCDPN